MPQDVEKELKQTLDGIKVSNDIRRQAWNAFFSNDQEREFNSAVQGLALPQEAKQQLWYLKRYQITGQEAPQKSPASFSVSSAPPSTETPFLQRPLVSIPSPMAPPSAGQSGPEQFVRGAAQGVTGAASQFTTPQNLATMTAIAGGSAIPVVGPAIAGTAGVVFTYEMAKNLVQSLPQGWAAMKKGDWATVGRLFGEDVVNALAMRGAAKGAAGALRPGLEARAARTAPPLRYTPALQEPTITAETEPRYPPDYTPVTPRLSPGAPPPGRLPAGGPGPRQLPAPRTSQPIDQFSRASGVPLPRIERLADMSVEDLRGRREYLARALRSETSRIPDPFQTEPSAVARGKEAGAPELRPTPALKPGEPRFQTRESAQREIQAIDLLIEDKLGQMGLRPSPGASLFEPPRPPAPPPQPEAAPPAPTPVPPAPAPAERPTPSVSEPPTPKPRKPRAKPKPAPPTEPPPGTEVVAKKTITPPPPGAPPVETAPPATGIDVSNVVPEARARIQRVFETVQAHGGSGVIEITVPRPGKREIRIGANVNLDTPADIIQQIQRAGGAGTAEFVDPGNKVKWRIELTPEQTPPPGAPPRKPKLGSERGSFSMKPTTTAVGSPSGGMNPEVFRTADQIARELSAVERKPGESVQDAIARVKRLHEEYQRTARLDARELMQKQHGEFSRSGGGVQESVDLALGQVDEFQRLLNQRSGMIQRAVAEATNRISTQSINAAREGLKRLGSERGGITLMPRSSKLAETVAGPKIETARGYWIGPTGEVMNVGREMHDWKLPKGMATMQQAMEKGWIRVREDIVEADPRSVGSIGFMDAFQMAASTPHAKSAGHVVLQIGKRYVEVPLSRVEEFLADPEKYIRNWRGEMFSQTAPPSAGLEYA